MPDWICNKCRASNPGGGKKGDKCPTCGWVYGSGDYVRPDNKKREDKKLR